MHSIHTERHMHKHIILITALAAILPSCTAPKDELVPSTGAKMDLTLKITSVSPATKTYIEERTEGGETTYIPKWAKGDKIGLFLDSWSSNAKPVLEMENSSSNGSDASFQGVLRDIPDGSHTIYTFYPASALIGTEKDNKLSFSIPEVQHIGNSFDPAADIVIGKGYRIVAKTDSPEANINNIQFSRILATVMIDVANKSKASLDGEKIRKITLTSNSALTGTIQWDYSNEGISVISASKSVTAELGTPIPIDGKTPAYVLINPVTLEKGSSLVATLETDKHRITKTISSLPQALSFPGNKVSALKLNITDTDSTVEGPE